MRRLRRTPALRRLVAETRLSVDDLVAPLFVREGIEAPQPIASLPGVVQHTRESLRKEVAELADLGVPAVILFGVPATKDAVGSGSWDPEGIVQLALADLRAEVGDDLVLMAERSGFSTGISQDGLLDAIDFAQAQLKRPLGGRSIAWLQRQREKRPHFPGM